VIDADFDYYRPETVADALDMLARRGADAMVLAGGQSLLPALKAGRLRPAVLVDVSRLDALGRIAVAADDGHLVVGGLVRHHDLATDPLVRRHAPLLAHAAGLVADPQVRHRGTIGGSLVWADPAADLPPALLALDAVAVVTGPAGQRVVSVADLLLAPGELLTEIRVPLGAAASWSYQKFHRAALQWAIVAVAAVRDHAGRVTVVVGNLAGRPVRATGVAAAVAAGSSAVAAAAHAADGTTPPPDHRASAAYRQHLARVLTERALVALGISPS